MKIKVTITGEYKVDNGVLKEARGLDDAAILDGEHQAIKDGDVDIMDFDKLKIELAEVAVIPEVDADKD